MKWKSLSYVITLILLSILMLTSCNIGRGMNTQIANKYLAGTTNIRTDGVYAYSFPEEDSTSYLRFTNEGVREIICEDAETNEQEAFEMMEKAPTRFDNGGQAKSIKFKGDIGEVVDSNDENKSNKPIEVKELGFDLLFKKSGTIESFIGTVNGESIDFSVKYTFSENSIFKGRENTSPDKRTYNFIKVDSVTK